MPNHIANRLEFSGPKEKIEEVMNHLRSKWDDGTDNPIDFNKIISMPEILRGKKPYSSTVDAAKNYLIQNGHPVNGRERLWNPKKTTDSFFHDPDYPHRAQNLNDCIDAGKQTGFVYWYDWSLHFWGTKWGAYSSNSGDNWITFDTAWSAVPGLISILASMFPDVEITYKWADEDSGNNTGIAVFNSKTGAKFNGVLRFTNGSDEAYRMFLDLRPDCDYIKKIDGQWTYIDEEE